MVIPAPNAVPADPRCRVDAPWSTRAFHRRRHGGPRGTSRVSCLAVRQATWLGVRGRLAGRTGTPTRLSARAPLRFAAVRRAPSRSIGQRSAARKWCRRGTRRAVRPGAPPSVGRGGGGPPSRSPVGCQLPVAVGAQPRSEFRLPQRRTFARRRRAVSPRFEHRAGRLASLRCRRRQAELRRAARPPTPTSRRGHRSRGERP